ncbi:MAG: MarR family transcriptional regulator [Anaerostipes sp.]|jgi:DNA-binding MarR family transcriptional regulator|nr:MarR family transcriptional regulator [Anaerostipes sp.]MDD3746826.1 MarR family transcriptional regulator [Anaerostipes sp.]
MFCNDDIYRMLHKISHKEAMLGMMYVREENIHPRQLPTLMTLLKESDLTQRELAKRLGVQPSTMNVTISRMEKNGLVQRKQDSKDQRRSLISITEQGKECFDRIKVRMDELANCIWKDFSEKEKEDMRRLLTKYVTSLDNQLEAVDKSKIEEVSKVFGRRHHV